MCAQRKQTPVHRSCERALRVPCRRHSPLHISGFRHWQMGKGSSVPFTNHARRVLSPQQPTAHARMLEQTPTIVLSPPFDVRVRAPLRAAVAWCRSFHLPPPLCARPAAAAARTTRRECRITAVSRCRLRVRLRVGFSSWGGDGGDPIGCGANKHPRVIVPRTTTARTVLSS